MTSLPTLSASHAYTCPKPINAVKATYSDDFHIRRPLPPVHEDAERDAPCPSNITIFKFQDCYCPTCADSVKDTYVETGKQHMRPPSRYVRKPQMGWASAMEKNLNEST